MNEIDSRNKYGETPLMVAAERGQTDEVRRLVQAGADATLKDNDGSPALDKARHAGRHEIIEILGGPKVPQGSGQGPQQAGPVQRVVYHPRYKTARAYGAALQILGKTVMLLGIGAWIIAGLILVDTSSGGSIGKMAAASALFPGGLLALVMGLFMVVSGQLLHAQAFTADANGEMLEIMKAERVRRS